jgi:hypothetical protein
LHIKKKAPPVPLKKENFFRPDFNVLSIAVIHRLSTGYPQVVCYNQRGEERDTPKGVFFYGIDF